MFSRNSGQFYCTICETSALCCKDIKELCYMSDAEGFFHCLALFRSYSRRLGCDDELSEMVSNLNERLHE